MSTTTKTSAEKLKDAVAKFDALETKYADLGASDTEPDGVWQWLLARAYKGSDVTAPDNPNEWQLYSDMAGAKTAAKAMGRAAQKAIDIIQESKLNERSEIAEVLRYFMWRVDWED